MNATMTKNEVMRIVGYDGLQEKKGAFVLAMIDFIDRADAAQKDLKVHLESIINALDQGKVALWIGTKEGELASFLIAEIQDTRDGRQCFISYAWSKDYTLGQQVWKTVRTWAEENECVTANFLTRRNDRAYSRLLRRAGFEKKNVEFEVKLWTSHPEV